MYVVFLSRCNYRQHTYNLKILYKYIYPNSKYIYLYSKYIYPLISEFMVNDYKALFVGLPVLTLDYV